MSQHRSQHLEWVDFVIVGGGLAGGLAALRLKATRPEFSLRVVDSGEPGARTWSFHASDLPPRLFPWVESFAAGRWSRYEVRFPSYARVLDSDYRSIRSEEFFARARVELGQSWCSGQFVRAVEAVQGGALVRLEDGSFLRARCVLDARGAPGPLTRRVGYQKFLGLDVRLKSPHGLTRPVLMDATCAQSDGYRFFYVLPWTSDTLLIEDTYYSDDGGIDSGSGGRAECEIRLYAERQGWEIESVLRRESGALPIPLVKDWFAPAPIAPGLPAVPIGMSGGFFHPTTGYSLPRAAEIADVICGVAPGLAGAMASAVAHAVAGCSRRWARQDVFFRLLNRMLFEAALPRERIQVFSRFYRLNERLIQRFYASRFGVADRARTLLGKPPVPVTRALRVLAPTERRGIA